MNLNIVPSLQQKSLVKVAIALWTQENVMDLVANFSFSSLNSFIHKKRKEWQNIKDEVLKSVQELPLPDMLKNKLSTFIVAVGSQVLIWKHYYQYYFNVDMKMNISKLCWTAQGTVDKKKTAEVFVNDENLSIYTRYNFACDHCLEDHINALWKQLSYEDVLLCKSQRVSRVVEFWSYYVAGEMAQLDRTMKAYCRDDNVTPYEYAFLCSAKRGNEAATRYFFQKLSPEEKEKMLITTAEYIANECNERYAINDYAYFSLKHMSDVLRFLLSRMDEEQQRVVFSNHSYSVLKCFLDWPWQSLFMKMANDKWNILSEENYAALLYHILHGKIPGKLQDFNHLELFQEFWQQSCSNHKKYVINEDITSGTILLYLFMLEDREIIKLIIDDMGTVERNGLFFGHVGQIICGHLVESDKWDFLKFFIHECISSKDGMIKFKKEFKGYMRDNCLVEESIKKEIWNKFSLFLSEFIAG